MISILCAAALLTPAPKATVQFFVLEGCPIARKYSPTINKLVQEFRPRQVEFTMVHVDPSTDLEDARAFAKEFGFKGSLVLDGKHVAARAAGVTNVPTAVVSANGKYVYVGRIDDRFPDLGVQREPKRHDLRIALEEVLAGKKVSVPKTKVVGCTLPTLQ